jgi:hypothetical protein
MRAEFGHYLPAWTCPHFDDCTRARLAQPRVESVGRNSIPFEHWPVVNPVATMRARLYDHAPPMTPGPYLDGLGLIVRWYVMSCMDWHASEDAFQ